MTNPKMIQVAFLTFAIVLLTGCNNTNTAKQTQQPQESQTSQQTQQSSQNTSANTFASDEIVATINGEELTGADVNTAQQAYAQQGQQISQEQAIEQAINQELLAQKATEEGFTPTTKEAEATIEEQLGQRGSSLEQYKEQVNAQGGSYEEQLVNIKANLAIQNYLDAQLESMTFDVTDEEANTFYDQYKEQSPQEIPPFETIKAQIITSLKQQKEQDEINSIIQDLRAEADIEMNQS